MGIQIIKAVYSDSDKSWKFIRSKYTALVPTTFTLFNKIDEVLTLIEQSGDDLVNKFFTLAHHNVPAGCITAVRSKSTFGFQDAMGWDIDGCDTAKVWDYARILADFLQITKEHFIIVNSGNGIHFYVKLKTNITEASYFDTYKQDYVEMNRKLDLLLASAELPGHFDNKIFDAARIMRLPGTTNRKEGKPDTLCFIVSDNKNFPLVDINLKQLSGRESLEKENVSPGDIKRSYPYPDFPEIVKECRFVQWAINNPNEVHEPDLFTLGGILVVQDSEVKTTIAEIEMNARGIFEHVHGRATHSASLARSSVDEKWAQAERYGARKCSTVASEHPDICRSCPHSGRIVTPLALKSEGHISSVKNGFWVFNAKGMPIHPHYEDLSRVFKKERNVMVTGCKTILLFEGGRYVEEEQLMIKSWIETKVTPTEPIREVHRVEFMNKVFSGYHLSSEGERELFVNSTRGKINFKNGVLDIKTGFLHSHSPKFGFRYVLPYDYEPDIQSEFFSTWLDDIACHDKDIRESLLDVMAYCLWPEYSDHLFTFLIGEGSNGKSTFCNIISALLGPDNCSTISLAQLCERFSVAELGSKLVNLGGESGERKISQTQMNLIKELSAGAVIMAEKKGKQAQRMQSTAKLIFAADKLPTLPQDGESIKRRLLAIPFNKHIVERDSSIEERLKTTEISAIASQIVRRIRDNIIVNHGAFKVHRTGDAAAKLQAELLDHGNSVCDWAKECLEVTKKPSAVWYISVDDAYAHYRNWCQESGVRHHHSKIGFAKKMYSRIIPLDVQESEKRAMVGKDYRRVFPRIRLKDDSEQEEVNF